MSNLNAADRPPWWKGVRGEWLVLGQVALIGLVFFGPRDRRLLPARYGVNQ